MLIWVRFDVSSCPRPLVRQGLGLAIVNPLTVIEFEVGGMHRRRLAFSIPYRIALARPKRRP
jgi:hypothetical protein